MKFLPKQSHITFTQIYSGEPILELYIDNTKNAINENLPTLFQPLKSSNISFKERQAIKKFTQIRTQLTLKPADKNLGLVVLNTDDYLHLCTTHLSNTNTYRQTDIFPAARIHKKLQDTLIDFSEILKPHKKLYDCLLPSEKKTQAPRFYGIPKVHKRFTVLPPIRPIVSHSNSLLTPTGKFIDHILQPIAKSYPDYLHNSTALIRLLQCTHIPDNAILVTIDVESLYPSIPQAECLSVIYEEMHARKDLLLFTPNLIIKLLHTNMNYNYFEFGPLTFQQVKGTAMGAAFSPTVANIFLSVILRTFLPKQHLKPLLLKRYIDDIFLIWQHSYEDLVQFFSSLNQFHPSIHYTWNSSATSIDYLDVTVFKGATFEITNILDTATFQKSQNLYQYLHYSSNHPPSVFKGLIVGECIRYVRTNSTRDAYIASLELFKQRLIHRQYPPKLIEKTTNLIKYSQRQHYLNESKSSQLIPRRKPVFKCLPPPRFSMLKEIVLQEYHLIQKFAPRPVFIALRHKTIGQHLIRSKVYHTDEQLIDMLLTVDSQTTDHTLLTMPALKSISIATTCCNHFRCVTCGHLNCNNYFQSTANKKVYTIQHSFKCTSRNVIYLITCTKCKKQYVGYTTNQLNQRINRHRSNIINNKDIYISRHFNFFDHNLRNLSVQIIDTASNISEPKKLEKFWILTLETYVPKGLNVTTGLSIN